MVVEHGRIVDVREPGMVPYGETVELDGLVLAPGFIDCHTHYDAQVLWDPALTPSSWHGITTAVLGNCGFGVAPTRPEHREWIVRTLENVEAMSADALNAGMQWSFESFPEYLDALERLPLGLNVAAMIGHTPLRLFVLGEDAVRRRSTDAEIATMKALVGEALDAGAVGFATSKNPGHVGAWGNPVPSRLADPAEIFEIAQALTEKQRGVIAINEGSDFGWREVGALARQTRRNVTWTAITTDQDVDAILSEAELLGELQWPQLPCRAIIMQIVLSDPAPLARAAAFGEVLAVPQRERARIYADPAWRERARRDTAPPGSDNWRPTAPGAEARRPFFPWSKISVAETSVHHALVNGPSMAELAARGGVDPLDVFCDLALAEDLGTRFRVVLANDDEDELAVLLKDDRLLLGLSDAGAHASQLVDAVFSTYLLEHWVRETGVLSLEKAVWRLTGHPAFVFGLPGRGRIAAGAHADLVAFDPAAVGVEEVHRVWDQPGGADRLIARSRGYEGVWINGVRVAAGGVATGSAAGVVIRDGGL